MHYSGELLCCLVVVHDRFVNCCIAMLYSGVTGLDMVQEALCFPDIMHVDVDGQSTFGRICAIYRRQWRSNFHRGLVI